MKGFLYRARGVGAAIGPRIARRGKHRGAEDGDLLVLGVDALRVANRVHAQLRAFVATDTGVALASTKKKRKEKKNTHQRHLKQIKDIKDIKDRDQHEKYEIHK